MSYNNGPKTVADGLILYLDAANPRSYPGSGTNVYNLVGDNTHVLRNGANFTTVNNIKCFDCNTSGYYISPTANTQLLPTTGYTYIAWARMKSGNSEWRTLWRTQPDDHPLLVESSGVALGMYDNNGTGFNNCGYNTTPNYDIWCHWAVVGSTTLGTEFYINGVKVGSTVSQSAGGNYHDAIGGAAGSQPFGYIGTAMLYSTILTQPQILQNFNATKRRFGI